MELSAFGASLRRRWYLLILAFVVTVGSAVLTVDRVGPSYKAEGAVLLFPPKGTVQDGEAIEGNPYLFLGGLNMTRDVLVRAMASKTVREEIAMSHPDAEFTVSPDQAVSSPVMVIAVTAPTNDEAIATLTALMEKVLPTLDGLQGELGISRREYITTQTLTVDEEAELVRKNQIRAGIVVAGGAFAGSLLMIGLLDGLLMSRRVNDRKPKNQRKKDEKDGFEGSGSEAGEPKPPATADQRPPLVRPGEVRGHLTSVKVPTDEVDQPASARR